MRKGQWLMFPSESFAGRGEQAGGREVMGWHKPCPAAGIPGYTRGGTPLLSLLPALLPALFPVPCSAPCSLLPALLPASCSHSCTALQLQVAQEPAPSPGRV